jgi:hypothetical protein
MDLLSILLACNLYTADEPLVRAIAQSNSHGNVFSVVDPALDYRDVEVHPEPKTLDAALARVEEVVSKGGRPLLGLMQVPMPWMAMFGRDPKDAFDACINVSIGTAMLSALDHECAADAGPRAEPIARRPGRLPQTSTFTPQRTCVVRKYGQAIGMPDFELLISLELGGQRSVQAARVPVDAPIIFPAQGVRTWGPDCIFMPLFAEPPAEASSGD